MKKIFCTLGFIILLIATGCIEKRDESVVPDTGIRLRAVAPDYLAGLLETAGDAFFEENGIKVVMQYVPTDSIAATVWADSTLDMVIGPQIVFMDGPLRNGRLDQATFQTPFRLTLVLAGGCHGLEGNDKSLKDLLDTTIKRLVIRNPETATQGRLARRVLEKDKRWKQVQDKLILAGSDEQVRSYLETGEADAGIVFESSLGELQKICVAEQFTGLDKTIDRYLLQCGSALNGSGHIESARAFIDMLESDLCPLYKRRGVYVNH